MKKRVFAAVVFFVLVLAGALVAQRTLLENERAVEATGSAAASAGASEGAVLLANGEIPRAVETASSEDCLAALAVAEGSSQLMAEQRRLHIQSVLKEAGGPLERALAADIAGYRPETTSVLDNGLPASMFWAYSAPNPLGERELSAAERRRLKGVLQSGGIEALAALDDAELLSARWGDTTLTAGQSHLGRGGSKIVHEGLISAPGSAQTDPTRPLRQRQAAKIRRHDDIFCPNAIALR